MDEKLYRLFEESAFAYMVIRTTWWACLLAVGAYSLVTR